MAAIFSGALPLRLFDMHSAFGTHDNDGLPRIPVHGDTHVKFTGYVSFLGHKDHS